ncbi:ATP-binding protein [Gramella jeungdoensis]|uniref:histidine kinase n=1 Tax=Gramella jeungdoensis TaxID=708091 RepID=A0ABT0Z532_9FLAO|nr:ATP-binding protein [Gramella jeungdoensis]MCM8569879.1 ATP-binding protein [Gramella jeungdoensis]
MNNSKTREELLKEFEVLQKDYKALKSRLENTVLKNTRTELDLTLAKKKEEKNELHLMSIYNTVEDVIFQLNVEENGDFRFNLANKAFFAVTGLTETQVIGKLVSEVIPEPSLSLVIKKYNEAITERKIVKWEEVSNYPSGELTGQVTVSPIFDKNGKCIELVGSVHDITDLKKREELLKQKNFEIEKKNRELKKAIKKAEDSDRLKSAFLANMSHEIRTPMNGILGFSELLQEADLSIEEQREYIDIIRKSGTRMLNIINDIIDISKIESNQVELHLREANINEKIRYAYRLFKPDFEIKDLKVNCEMPLPDEKVTIITDGEKLYAILTNLVSNAIKYTPEGSIEFGYTLNEKKGEFEFFVKDTGIGIPKDSQEAIFKRFVQAAISDRKAIQGAGLGLSITKAYVEMLGGRIWVDSKEGEGSSFHFTIPQKSVPEKTKKSISQKHVSIPKELENLKMLIVEDDSISKLFVRKIIKDFIPEIKEAGNGLEAVETCRKNPDLDLILMDMQMPEMNGFEATRKIREFNKDIIIIAQTAYSFSSDKQKALEAGCTDYISKPLSRKKLLQKIQEYF